MTTKPKKEEKKELAAAPNQSTSGNAEEERVSTIEFKLPQTTAEFERQLASMKHIPPVTLYGTLACHLCEAAMHVLQPLIADGLRVSEVDISDSDELMQRYQMRIPVLRRTDSGAELDFPFDLAQVMDWLGDDLREEG